VSLQPYASRTGTRRNLDALQGAGWRLLCNVTDRGRYTTDRPIWTDGTAAGYGLDNGAWGAHAAGRPFNVPAFEWALHALGSGADWIVVPDIVAGGLASLEFSRHWLPRVQGIARPLLAVQDGMTPADLASMVGPDVGLAVGGSTRWKISSLAQWGNLAAKTGAYLHVLRVNTVRRIRMCHEVGANSFDGTSCSRFAVNVPHLTAAAASPSGQLALLPTNIPPGAP